MCFLTYTLYARKQYFELCANSLASRIKDIIQLHLNSMFRGYGTETLDSSKQSLFQTIFKNFITGFEEINFENKNSHVTRADLDIRIDV